MSIESLKQMLEPVLALLPTLDLNNFDNAAATLNTAFPLDSSWGADLKSYLLANQDEEWLFPNEHRGIRYGRLDSGSETGFTIDSVDMNKAGASHLHTNGEVDLAIIVDGSPQFDGHSEGWVVYPPNSWHRPTVSGGRMLILYFLPGGGLNFCREAPEGALIF